MMNKIYKVVFNQKLQVFQVVSEFAKGHSKAEKPKALKKNMLPLSAKTWAAVLAAVAVLSGSPVFAADTAAVTVSNGTNTTATSTVDATDGHTDYKVNLNDAISLGSVTTGNTVMNTNGVTIGSGSTAVSLTSAGLNNGGNTITNVKAGTNGTDAVNVSQMNAATAGSKTTVSNGTNTTVSSSTAADGHTNYQVNLNDAISLGSVTTGNTVMNTNGVTIGSGSTAVSLTSTGLNNGGNKITNVAAGTADTDAVNKGQMTNAIDESMKYFKANSMGTEAFVAGSDAVAVGSGAVSGGSEAVALGLNTAADGDQSLALGVNAGTSSGTTGAIAVGNTAKASQDGAVAIGQKSGANGKRSTVVGDSAQAVGDQALALGADASASGTNGTALGTSASTAGSSATAVGSHASAAGGSAAAIGDSASASGGDSVALGASSQASGTNDISLGASAGVGTQSGSTSKIQQNRISIGANAGQNGSGNENTAIGLNAGDNVSGNFNVAMGSSAGGTIDGDANTAIGYEANKNGSGSHSTAVGASTTAANAATALGYLATAGADNSVAIGYAAQAKGTSGVAVGDSAIAVDNSIALGHNSIANQADSSDNSYLTGLAAGTNGVVSVGSSEGDTIFQRRIINVADGSNGTDAVNVNQLKKAQTSIAELIGGNVTLNTDGSYGQFSLTDTAGTVHHYDTLAEALGAVTSDQIKVATDNAVTYTDSNKTNINAGGTISKVTAATSSDQAVNFGQMNSAIAASQTKYYSVNSNESGNQDNTGATGENAIAAGPAATAVGDRSISIGDNTKAQGTNSIAIGNSNTTLDRQATAYGQSSIAIGSSASSAGNNSIALGNYALTEVQNSTSTTVNSAIAIGDQAQATSDQAVALGKNAHASGVNAFAQGNTSSATNESSIAVGTNASSSGTASTVIGKNSAVSGTHSGLIGTSMSTDTNQTGQALTGSDTYVVGNGNGTVGGTNSSIMGNSNTVGTTVTDPNGITHSYNTVNTSILGNSNTVTAQDADVIGHGNTVGKKNLNAAGIADGTIDTAAGSGVFGGNNTVYGSGNRIIGNNNTDSNLDGVFILGNNVTAGLADSVYLGSNSAYVTGSDASSTTAGVNSYSSVTIGSGNYTFAGANAAGVVTVGSVGSERRIQNVSAGLVSSTSTDAVNGSQLYTLTQPLRFAGDNSTIGTTSGSDVNVLHRGSDQAMSLLGGADSRNLSDKNIGVVADAANNKMTVKLANNITLGKADPNGSDGSISVLAEKGGEVRIHDGSVMLRNSGDSDAIYLQSHIAGATSLDGSSKARLYVIQGSTKSPQEVALLTDGMIYGGDAESAGLDPATNKSNTGKEIKKVLNQQVNVIGGITNTTKFTAEDNLGVVSDGTNNLKVRLAKDLRGISSISNQTTTGGTTTGTKITLGNITNIVNVGGAKITNVAAGDVNSMSTDAVNGSQLYQTNQNVKAAKTVVNAGQNVTVTSSVGADKQSVYTVNADLSSVASAIGGTSSVDTKTGAVKAGLTVNGNTYNNVQDAVNAANTTVSSTDGSVKVTPTNNTNGSHNYDVSVDYSKVAENAAISYKANNSTAQTVTLKKGLDFTNGKNTTASVGADGVVKYDLNDNLNLGEKGTNGKDGSIGVNGTNGSSVTINGKDGSIGIVGKDGKDGLTMKAGKGKDGIDGKNGADGMTRITYTDDKNQSHEVATLDDGLKFAGNTGSVAKKLNETMTIKGTGTKADSQYDSSNIKTMVNDNGDMIIGLDKNLKADTVTVGGKGADGTDGVNGSIGVKGKDGKDGVTISSAGKDGADGTDGHIGINGKDGASADIHVVKGANGVDGTDGYNGKDGIDRIVYEDHNGHTQTVATMNDGMKYGGDTGAVINKKLNEQVNVIGGISDTSKLTADDNIGVTSDGSNNLKVRLSKDLKGLDTVTTKTITADTGNITTINATTVNGNTIKAGDTVIINNQGADMGGTKVTHLKDGDISPSSTDAVNGSQLYGTETRINRLGNRINRVGAGAAALAGLHPLDFDPDDKWDFAAGYGNYKNANAVAIGAYYRPNEDTMFSVGGSFSGGENMVNVGVSWKFGQKSHISRSRVSMAKDMLAMKNQIETLTKKLAAYESGQPVKLAPIATGAMTFPDVPENHWAYEYVKNLAERGYLKGYPDGEFKGDRAMTRYEYAAIIYRALQNGAPSDGNMTRSVDDFGPELVKVQNIDRFRVDRISGKDNDRHKVERVRVNDKDDKAQNVYRDVYGNHIQK